MTAALAAAFCAGGGVALLGCAAAFAWLHRAEQRDAGDGGTSMPPPFMPSGPSEDVRIIHGYLPWSKNLEEDVRG